MGDPAANQALIERFWADLARRDFDAVGAYFTEEGARGPVAIAARLRLGLEPLERYVLNAGPIVADGDMVITEHSEDWYWPTGEHVQLPFVSVHEVRDGMLVRWWDYWDLGTLMNAAPAQWAEQIMVGYQ